MFDSDMQTRLDGGRHWLHTCNEIHVDCLVLWAPLNAWCPPLGSLHSFRSNPALQSFFRELLAIAMASNPIAVASIQIGMASIYPFCSVWRTDGWSKLMHHFSLAMYASYAQIWWRAGDAVRCPGTCESSNCPRTFTPRPPRKSGPWLKR